MSKFCTPQYIKNIQIDKLLQDDKSRKKIGNKGLNLLLMSNICLDINISQFFIINSNVNNLYQQKGTLSKAVINEIKEQELLLQLTQNKDISDHIKQDTLPMSVSVRSSGDLSMPGMMSTFLNVGITSLMFKSIKDNKLHVNITKLELNFFINYLLMLSNAIIFLEKQNKTEDKAQDQNQNIKPKQTKEKTELINQKKNQNIDFKINNSLECESCIVFLQNKLSIINNINHNEHLILDTALFFDTLQEIKKLQIQEILEDKINFYYAKKYIKYDILNDAMDQVLFFIEAVFASSVSSNIETYKQNHNANNVSVAVIVQKMIYGNLDGATGVCFSSNPITGDHDIYGEIILKTQGDSIVSGAQTPLPLTKQVCNEINNNMFALIESCAKKLENLMHFPQDIEFTIQSNKLFIMQTRDAKMSLNASLEYFIKNLNAKNLNKCIAILRNINISNLLYTRVSKFSVNDILAKGTPSNSGAVKCKIAISDEYILNNQSENLCLVRKYTSVEDYQVAVKCKAIITKIGGSTSHASIIARALNKTAICGINELEIYQNYIKCNNIKLNEGDEIVIDGNNGIVFSSNVSVEENKDDYNILQIKISKLYEKIVQIQNKTYPIIAINADSEEEIQYSKQFNINKIGLCRTEHILSTVNILNCFREFVLSFILNLPNKQEILHRFCKLQVEKINLILKHNFETTIRLLDPPLHEFFTLSEVSRQEIANSLYINYDILNSTLSNMLEVNPMLGNRGARLGVSIPEIYESQIKAIILSSYITKNTNIKITIPFINDLEEFLFIKNLILNLLTKEKIENLLRVNNIITNLGELEVFIKNIQNIKIGAMIETPRSCYIADKLAKYADYFSFGTNDLTQFALSISRDDIHKISSRYYTFWGLDPFKEIDQKCVGKLMQFAINKAKKINPNIEISVCGEHAQVLSNVKFFHKIKVNTLSVSSFNVLKLQLFLITQL